MANKDHPLYVRWKNMRDSRVAEWDDFKVFLEATEGGFFEGAVMLRVERLLPFGPDNFVWVTREEAYQGDANPNYKGVLEEALCAFCGKPMIINVNSPRTHCSSKCNSAAQRKLKICKVCKEPFLEGLNPYTCSVECSDLRDLLIEEDRDRRRAGKTSATNYGSYVWRLCDECGQRMKLRPSDVAGGRKYCSRVCYGKAQSKRQAGENHHNWKGGITKNVCHVRRHPLYAAWRTKVFERDEYTCQSCFEVGGKLHAHHIIPFKEDPKLRLKVTNGITLCGHCHRKWHVFDRKGLFEGLEKTLQTKAIKRFKEAGFFVFNVHGGPMQMAGVPDTLLCCSGLFAAVEYKVFPNFLTPLQKIQAKAVKTAGAPCYMCRSMDDAERIIDDMHELAAVR